jgi:DNA-binding MarR family transcriptional regulator
MNGASVPHGDHDPLADDELTFLLGIAFQTVLAEFNHRLSAAGYGELRPAHGMIFQILQGPGRTSTELAEQLGITKQAAGQMITELEERGYVRRQDHPKGGRRRLIILTDKAVAHLQVAGTTLHQLEAELAEKMGDADLTGLRKHLAQLIRALSGSQIPPLRPVWLGLRPYASRLPPQSPPQTLCGNCPRSVPRRGAPIRRCP